MRVRLSEQSLEWLCDHRVFLQGYRVNGHRLTTRDTLFFANKPPLVEPYCGIYAGNQICSIGSFSYTGSSIPAGFSLGRYCSFSWDIKFPGPRHPIELLSTGGFVIGSVTDMWKTYLADSGQRFDNIQPNPQKPGTIFGHDVWIGQDVTIMSGLNIGNGAVIAAASVVTRDVQPFAVVGGNPARFIRWRFPEDVIETLTEIRWWRYDYPALQRIDLSCIQASIRDLRAVLADLPPFEPKLVDLLQMPHAGVV